jgi:hypothetical protein
MSDSNATEAEKTFTEAEAHKFFGVKLNNAVWDFLGKEFRSSADNEAMIQAAHASYYHWSVIGKPENFARGQWMLARVYAVTNNPPAALKYAGMCHQTCQAHTLADFDLAYAYEALARAYAVAGNEGQYRHFYMLAEEAAASIADPEDRKIFDGDLEAQPWFGYD